MKESFSELYARLYSENFAELEELRKKEKNITVGIISIFCAIVILSVIWRYFIILGIIALIIYIVKIIKMDKMGRNKKSYSQLFKEKIIGPIIENVFEGSKFDSKGGLSSHEYRKAGYKDSFDRYHSEDLILAPLSVNSEVVTSIMFAEVHTERESRDSDGDTTYVTVFSGLAGSFLISKDVGNNIYIRTNGRVSNWNKSKVKMDMPEFEKIFDVESDDAILAMRILTADVMAEMIDLYKKYKYRFEINIVKNTVYMRLSTGSMFEPGIFNSSMEYKQLEKYYLVLRAIMSIAAHIYDTVDKLEI